MDAQAIRDKKSAYRRRYIKWLINKHTERQTILEKELEKNSQIIKKLRDDFNKIRQEEEGNA